MTKEVAASLTQLLQRDEVTKQNKNTDEQRKRPRPSFFLSILVGDNDEKKKEEKRSGCVYLKERGNCSISSRREEE